jgi:predicted MPP superfamily phosphohydrolase
MYAGVYPFFVWHGSTFLLALIILAGILIKLPFDVVRSVLLRVPFTRKPVRAVAEHPAVQRLDKSRRQFLRYAMYSATAVSFGGTAYGMFVGRHSAEINNVDLLIRDLPPDLTGLTIGFMSDIHSSLYMTRNEMDEYVRLMNSLGVDLVLLGGDFVNSTVNEVYPFAEAFNALRAPLGVYGVLGNHDFYTRQVRTVAREIEQAGVRLLRDSHVVLRPRGYPLLLAGVDDVSSDSEATQHMSAALEGAPEGVPRLMLCHRPYFLPAAARLEVHHLFSGHTHGGQIVLGRFGTASVTPAMLVSDYVWGEYRHGRTQMYVSRGIGTVGIPVRLNCPPEITKFVLRPAKGSPES